MELGVLMPYHAKPSTLFGGSRPTTLYVPNAYDSRKQYPLLLLLHSYGASGTDIKTRLGLDEGPQFDDGCLILSPTGSLDGANPHWNYWTEGGSDFAYLKGLVDDVVAAWPVDPHRKYVLGYSNGAFMAHQLCIAYPSLFTAKFTFAGSFGTSDATTAATYPIPSVSWHGDGDTTVLTAGDDDASSLPGSLAGHGGVGSSGYLSATATAAANLSRNGATGSLGANYGSINLVSQDGSGSETTRQAFSGTTAGTAVEQWTGVGINHTVSFPTNKGQIVYTWLQEHHRGL